MNITNWCQFKEILLEELLDILTEEGKAKTWHKAVDSMATPGKDTRQVSLIFPSDLALLTHYWHIIVYIDSI